MNSSSNMINETAIPEVIITNITKIDSNTDWVGIIIEMSDSTKNIIFKVSNIMQSKERISVLYCDKWIYNQYLNDELPYLSKFIGSKYESVKIEEYDLVDTYCYEQNGAKSMSEYDYYGRNKFIYIQTNKGELKIQICNEYGIEFVYDEVAKINKYLKYPHDTFIQTEHGIVNETL